MQQAIYAAVAVVLAAIEALHAPVLRAFQPMRVLKTAPRPPPEASLSLEAEITAPKDTYRAEPLPEGPVATNTRLRTCGYAPLGRNSPCAKSKALGRAKALYRGIWLPAGAERLRTAPRTRRAPGHTVYEAAKALAYSPVGGSPR